MNTTKLPLRVLIIEDSEDDAELTRIELEQAGYELEWKRVDTEDAFLDALSEEWHLIISDYQMPTFDGLRAFERYRQSQIDAPFIFVSGALGEERAVAAMRAGAKDYILKGNLGKLGITVSRELRAADDRRRKRAAESRAAREQRCLAAAMEAAGAGIIEFTIPVKSDIYITGQWQDLLGYAPSEIPHDDRLRAWMEARIQAEDLERIKPGTKLFHQGDARRFSAEFRMRHKDGRWIDVACLAHAIERDAAGRATHVVAVVLDQTQRRRLEEQVQQAQKMEAVGRLAGGVAHDFNNILTVILGYCDLLRADHESEELDQIKAAGQRAVELTRQLLAFSRRQVITPTVLNLNTVVAEMTAMVRRLIGEDIQVRALPARDLWNVEADRGQIEQVIMNLAVNSRDAMPKGGRLTMETANIELDASYCESNTDAEAGEYVMLAVTDTGTGMDAALIPRIFEPFFTTKEKGRGTGLGLSMVYGAVKQNRGHITVYSEPGRGTTFKVYWPRAMNAEAAKDPKPTRSTLPKGTETILVVEDEEALRKYACRLLGSLGYRTLQAHDGEHALEVAAQATFPIDLLMTDVIMPRLGGHELAQELLRRLPTLKVLFTSGYTADTIAREGILDEGINFLAKPYGQRELADRVRAALDQS